MDMLYELQEFERLKELYNFNANETFMLQILLAIKVNNQGYDTILKYLIEKRVNLTNTDYTNILNNQKEGTWLSK